MAHWVDPTGSNACSRNEMEAILRIPQSDVIQANTCLFSCQCSAVRAKRGEELSPVLRGFALWSDMCKRTEFFNGRVRWGLSPSLQINQQARALNLTGSIGAACQGNVWSSPSPCIFYTEARKDSMEEVGCNIDLEEAFPFGLEQETG